MTRFIKFLQFILAVVVGGFVGYDMVLRGVSIFNEKYIVITTVLWVMLEIALFVIYKLVEED